MSIENLVKSRRKTNVILAVILLAIVALLFFSVKAELMKYLDFIDRNSQPSEVTISANNAEPIKLVYDNKNEWQLRSPYQQRGSKTVLNALLGRINTSCEGDYAPDSVTSDTFAHIQIDDNNYDIGELNPITDKVYVKRSNDKGEQWMLCDKSIAAIALAPPLNFIDRNLYPGNVSAIKGGFGEMTINSQIEVPLDVLEIAEVSADKLDSPIDNITIFGDNDEKTYQVILNNDGKHLLLTAPQNDDKPRLVYVIKDSPELLRIIGLGVN